MVKKQLTNEEKKLTLKAINNAEKELVLMDKQLKIYELKKELLPLEHEITMISMTAMLRKLTQSKEFTAKKIEIANEQIKNGVEQND